MLRSTSVVDFIRIWRHWKMWRHYGAVQQTAPIIAATWRCYSCAPVGMNASRTSTAIQLYETTVFLGRYHTQAKNSHIITSTICSDLSRSITTYSVVTSTIVITMMEVVWQHRKKVTNGRRRLLHRKQARFCPTPNRRLRSAVSRPRP